jgi:hypothetical protein
MKYPGIRSSHRRGGSKSAGVADKNLNILDLEES